MIPKIEDRDYKYQGNNICSIFATLNIYADDNTTIVDSVKLQANFDISDVDNVVAFATEQLSSQVMDYMSKLVYIDNLRKQIFPTSIDFKDAINSILDPIQASLVG